MNTRSIELLGNRVDSNAKAIQANTESINAVAEAAGRTLRAVEILQETAEEDRVNFREHLERTDTAIAGINATKARVAAVDARCRKRLAPSGSQLERRSTTTMRSDRAHKFGNGFCACN